jgi:hypothetical protein
MFRARTSLSKCTAVFGNLGPRKPFSFSGFLEEKTLAFVILCTLIGVACALLHRGVLLILAVSVLLAVVAVLGGLFLHSASWGIAAAVVGSVAASQSAYTAAGLTLHLIRFGKLILPAQTAIGRQLRAQLEVPRSLPPELFALVAQLRTHKTSRGTVNASW